jgi:hypothetical protein
VAYFRACVSAPGASAPFAQAQSKFCETRGYRPDRVLLGRCAQLVPRVLVHVGELRGLIYGSDRGDRGRMRTYIHFMERPPVLACNPRGDQLYVVGGRYRVTRRGIEG